MSACLHFESVLVVRRTQIWPLFSSIMYTHESAVKYDYRETSVPIPGGKAAGEELHIENFREKV